MTTPAPACFDSAIQYEEWRRWASIARVQPRPRQDGSEVPNYCQDCTLTYQGIMMAEGRCAYPKTRFARVQEVAAGKLPVDFEMVGYEGEKPVTADYVPKKAVDPGFAQRASRSLRGAGGSPQPTPAPAVPSVGPRLAAALSRTGESAPPAAAPGTESEPAQS